MQAACYLGGGLHSSRFVLAASCSGKSSSSKERGHDLKRLMRTIVNSRTYQLSRVPNKTNADDRINYSRFIPRQLDAEVLLDAISSATGVPETLRHNSKQHLPGTLPPGSRAIHMVEPDTYPVRFLEVYGIQNRMAVPEAQERKQPAASPAYAGRNDLYREAFERGRTH